jgi:ankyrin repeat protein
VLSLHDSCANNANRATARTACELLTHTYRQTLLHLAARHLRPECIPLLLAKGADPLALDCNGKSALQLACEKSYSDNYSFSNEKQRRAATARALLAQEGSWLPGWQSACLMGAVSTNSVDILKVLIEHGFDCSGKVCPRGGTLLHCAAGYSSTQCAAVLVQQGADVHATDNDGNSPLEVMVLPELQPARTWEQRGVVWNPAKTATALLLLQHGATAVKPAGDCPDYADAVVQYVQWMRHELKVRDTTLAAHAACSTAVNSSNSSSSSSSSSDSSIQQQQCDAAAKTAVQVQLVRADTGKRSERVYTIDTAALARLHAAQGESGVSTLSSLIAPPAGWAATSDRSVKLLQYDGTYTNYTIYCILYTMLLYCCIAVLLNMLYTKHFVLSTHYISIRITQC